MIDRLSQSSLRVKGFRNAERWASRFVWCWENWLNWESVRQARRKEKPQKPHCRVLERFRSCDAIVSGELREIVIRKFMAGEETRNSRDARREEIFVVFCKHFSIERSRIGVCWCMLEFVVGPQRSLLVQRHENCGHEAESYDGRMWVTTSISVSFWWSLWINFIAFWFRFSHVSSTPDFYDPSWDSTTCGRLSAVALRITRWKSKD